jgi:molybdopterin synthase sulfur carrier subunit
MSVTVRVPTILRPLTSGEAEVGVDGGTLQEVLDQLEATHPGIRTRVLDDDGKLRRFVNVYVNAGPAGPSVTMVCSTAG